MKLSVIIPCYNAAHTIGNQLHALANQHLSEPWEVVVANNRSIDESMLIVEGFKGRLPNLRIVDASDIRGAAHARNVGAQFATGEALAYCDADDEVAFGWVEAIHEALLEKDFVASRFETEKLNPSNIQKYFRFHQQQVGLQLLEYPPYLPHSGGSGLGVKRSIHEAVGGFDESLPRLMDTDYCLRIQLAGHTLHFVPNAIIHIRCRDNYQGVFKQALLWAEYNALLYKRYGLSGKYESWRWKRYVREWQINLRVALHIRSKSGFVYWLFKFGWQIGMLKGSIKYGVPPV